MKNGPSIDKPITAVEAPTISRAARRARLSAGEKHRRSVNGRDIEFTLKRVPASQVEAEVTVWQGNERDQSRLTPAALADIAPSIRDKGIETPAYGRAKGNGFEVADGSRRRAAAIQEGADYLIWCAELTDQEMDHISTIGNTYKPTSAYERGSRYKRLLSEKSCSERELADSLGIDRKTMRRYLKTADLPAQIIDLYPTINDISGRTGESLANQLDDHMLGIAQNLAKRPLLKTMTVSEITKALLTPKPTQPSTTQKSWPSSSYSIDSHNDGLSISISKEVSEEVRKKIEKIVRKELNA